MTIINTNSISGISSITAQGSNGIEFYESSGVNQRLNITSAGRVGIGTVVPEQPAHVHAPNNSLSAIRLSGSASSQVEYDIRQGIIGATNAGFSIRDITNSATRLSITSAGNIGINDSSPSDALTVYKTNAGNPAGITIRNTEASSTYSHARLRLESQNGAAYGEIWADVANAGLRLGYNSSSTVKIDSAGNIVLLSGRGIDFSAVESTASGVTVSSSVLDDYEEGSWTPVIKSGSNTISYSGGNQYFRYTKIGCLVTVTFALNASTTSGTTGGGFKIEGLPFASRNLTNLRTIGTHVCYYGSGLRASQWPNFVHVGSNKTDIDVYTKTASSSNYDRDTVASVGANTYFFWQVTYETSA